MYGYVRQAGILIVLLVCAREAPAQVQRSMVNLGFEQTALTGRDGNQGRCFLVVRENVVPGWTTNHAPIGQGGGALQPVTTNACAPLSFRANTGERPIELWRNGFLSVPARAGSQFAELNANVPSKVYQNICMTNGEQVSWSFSHRGRDGQDVAVFSVDSSANPIVQARTGPASGGAIEACGGGNVTGAACNRTTASGGWADYSGSFTWTGPTAVQQIGFEATSSAGVAGSGNLLDDVVINLQSYAEFQQPDSAGREGAATVPLPIVVLSGNVAAELQVPLEIDPASTATLGSDFQTPNGASVFTITVPAGVYDGGPGSVFDLGLTLIDDQVIEDNETIIVNLQPSGDYVIASTQTCGVAGVGSSRFLILDDDVDIAITKTVDNPTPVAGEDVTFTVTVQNNTAAPTVGPAGTPSPLDSHDANVQLIDAIPTGIDAFAWTCAPGPGLPAASCPSPAGTGPLDEIVSLPAGDASAGGSLVFTIVASLDAATCAATTNDAIAIVRTPLYEGASAQTGFTTPTPGGLANNEAQASVDLLCADLQVQVTNTIASGPDDLPSDILASGATTTYTLTVTNLGPGAVTGAVLTNTPDAALDCPTGNPVTCAGPSAACPASAVTIGDLAAGVALGLLAPTAPDNRLTMAFDCTVQ